LAGIWTAQYDFGGCEGDLPDPANTGLHETLASNVDSSCSQRKNGANVNRGTCELVNVLTPGGPRVFLKIINSSQPNAQTYDNSDFKTGFNDSYGCSGDWLICYGTYATRAVTNVLTERGYVK
jgi:hypothetical protein